MAEETVTREMRFHPNPPDVEFSEKKVNAKRFLSNGNKIKAIVMFRGREVMRPEVGIALMVRFAEDLKEFATVEMGPRQEGRQVEMLLAPK